MLCLLHELIEHLWDGCKENLDVFREDLDVLLFLRVREVLKEVEDIEFLRDISELKELH